MSFSNRDHIYDHLPVRYRRGDEELLLKRFLTPAGDVMDGWDVAFDSFHSSIASTTASETWTKFWLLVLFGWAWFPWWFRLVDVRRFYGNFGRHLGRRGTRRGIELWLSDFGIVARVHTRTPPWSEFVWGETTFAIAEPLHIVVEILSLVSPQFDQCYIGQEPWGEAYYVDPRPLLDDQEITDLVKYVQPHSQEITIVWQAVA